MVEMGIFSLYNERYIEGGLCYRACPPQGSDEVNMRQIIYGGTNMKLNTKRMTGIVAVFLALLLMAGMAMAEAKIPEIDENTLIATFEAKSDNPDAGLVETGDPDESGDPELDPDDPNADTGEEDPEDIDDRDGEGEDGDEPADDIDSDVALPSLKLERIREAIMAIGDKFYLVATLTGFDGVPYTVRWQYDAGDELGWINIEDDDNLEYNLIDALTLAVVSDAENINYDWRILVTPIVQTDIDE